MSETKSQPRTSLADRNAERADAAAHSAAKTADEHAKMTPSSKKHVIYVSTKPETIRFNIQIRGVIYSSFYDPAHEYLCWRFPVEVADAVDLHHHVKTGRIRRVEE